MVVQSSIEISTRLCVRTSMGGCGVLAGTTGSGIEAMTGVESLTRRAPSAVMAEVGSLSCGSLW